ncbi:hypothetical protein ISO88_04090 [Morganella morganii subsp. morganii]|uniref:hypothetical protein n=1 Tax=Morganella morganii TaxID=582 RepID=UPI001BDA3E6A|nr:hypothetical protein [Morganella morganii]MBT0329051.1 hypothetical protein [Morganella morganii subsp. morganii]
MNMRSESKEIYGVSVLPVMAVLHRFIRWWALRDLKRAWSDDRFFEKHIQHRGWLHIADAFTFHSRYQRLREAVKAYQGKDVI